MSNDTQKVEQPNPQVHNPPVQISDEFVMPREVASRLIVCNKISNKLRKRCRRAMQTAVVSRAPILQEMKSNFVKSHRVVEGEDEYVYGNLELEKAARVYDITKAGKTVEQALVRLVAKLNMKQLLHKAARIPTKRRQAQWVALHGQDEATRAASEQRVNMMDEMLDAIETEIARRVL